MFNIKSFAVAAALSAGVIFAMPAAGQAMTSSVKIHTGSNSVHVNNKNKSNNWWARHCAISNDVKCGHHYSRSKHHGPYYGHYKKYRHHKSGVTIKVD